MCIIAFGSPRPILTLHEVKDICAAKNIGASYRSSTTNANYGQRSHIVTRVVYIYNYNCHNIYSDVIEIRYSDWSRTVIPCKVFSVVTM